MPTSFSVGSTTSLDLPAAGTWTNDGQVIVAERGRLPKRIAAWNKAAARDFARDCAARGRERIVEALLQIGHDVSDSDGLDGAVLRGAQPTTGWRRGCRSRSRVLSVLAADTTALAEGRRLEESREPRLRSPLEAVCRRSCDIRCGRCECAFVFAHSTDLRPAGPNGSASERASQLQRLVERLGLAVSS